VRHSGQFRTARTQSRTLPLSRSRGRTPFPVTSDAVLTSSRGSKSEQGSRRADQLMNWPPLLTRKSDKAYS